jgi:hypothetical protein
MKTSKFFDKCVIDNWSLEDTAYLLERDSREEYKTTESFVNALGNLSNFINAILLYDEIFFLDNGYQDKWQSFEWFSQNALLYLRPQVDPGMTEKEHLLVHLIRNGDLGAGKYLQLSAALDADLLISTRRAELLTDKGTLQLNNQVQNLLLEIDALVKNDSEKIRIPSLKAGVASNFLLPSLTQYVMSESSSFEDLLKVVMEIKNSGVIYQLKEKIQEASSNIRNYNMFQTKLQDLVKQELGHKISTGSSWAVKLNVLFLTITKTIRPEDIKSKSYYTFLKNITACRGEANGLGNHIERIFKRKI